jgi:hypothetical protein
VAAQPPQGEQQLAQLANHLRALSPSQLSSLQWLSEEHPLLQAKQRHSSYSEVSQLQFSLPGEQTTVSLSVAGQAGSGTLMRDGERWKVVVQGTAGFIYKADELPQMNQGGGNDAIEPPVGKSSNQQSSNEQLSSKSQVQPQPSSDTVTVDVVAAYAHTLVDIYGSQDAVIARIADVFATANQAYTDSNVPLQLNFVDTIPVDVDPDNTLPSTTVLDMVAGFNGTTELFSHVRKQTERVGADFTVMFRPYANDGYCGIAYLSGKDDSAYIANNMVSHTSLDCGDIVTAHELGHNMGLQHSRRQDDTGYVYPYALGYGEDGNFTTIMAYPESFNTDLRINKFSSPNLDCNGSPCGISYEDKDNGADAVYALNLRAQQIAGVRQRQAVNGELVVINVQGDGAVSYGNETCSANTVCEVEVDAGTTFSLTADSGDVATFEGWRGVCSAVSSEQCDVTIDGTTNIIADFATQYNVLDIASVVDNDSLTFETNAGAPWQITQQQASSGDSSVRAGAINNNQSSILRTHVAEGGELSFAAKTSSEEGYDKLLIKVNGQVVQELSGEQDWQAYSVTISNDGSDKFVIDFEYQKDGNVSRGDDTAWLDDIRFVPNGEPPVKQIVLKTIGAGWLQTTVGNCMGTCRFETSGGVLRLNANAEWQSPFVGWGGDCSGSSPECEVEVRDDITIYAFFEQNYTAIGTYNDALDNEQLQFFTPARDWEVRESSDAETATVLASPASQSGEYTQLVSYITGPGSLGFSYKIEATTERAGFDLKIDGETVLSDSGATGWQKLLSLSIPEGEHELEWQFYHEAEESPEGNRLLLDNVTWSGEAPEFVDLTLSTVGGAGAIRSEARFLCRDECTQNVAKQQTQRLTAEPDVNAEFVRWEGDCQGDNPVCELPMSADSSATAVFLLEQYTVTAESNGRGVINPQRVRVNQGEVVTFNVSPFEGHRQPSMSGCGVNFVQLGVYRSAPITEDCEVYAQFEPYQFDVTFDLGWHGVRTGGGYLGQLVNWGEAAEAPVFTVDDGWHFAAWSADFNEVKQDLDIEAIYQSIEGNYRVAIELGDGGRMNLQPVQYITPGQSVSVTLSPEPGQRVSRQVAGSCAEGEWQQDTYHSGPINGDCTISLGFNSVLDSGSLLLILSSEAQQ